MRLLYLFGLSWQLPWDVFTRGCCFVCLAFQMFFQVGIWSLEKVHAHGPVPDLSYLLLSSLQQWKLTIGVVWKTALPKGEAPRPSTSMIGGKRGIGGLEIWTPVFLSEKG